MVKKRGPVAAAAGRMESLSTGQVEAFLRSGSPAEMVLARTVLQRRGWGVPPSLAQSAVRREPLLQKAKKDPPAPVFDANGRLVGIMDPSDLVAVQGADDDENAQAQVAQNATAKVKASHGPQPKKQLAAQQEQATAVEDLQKQMLRSILAERTGPRRVPVPPAAARQAAVDTRAAIEPLRKNAGREEQQATEALNILRGRVIGAQAAKQQMSRNQAARRQGR